IEKLNKLPVDGSEPSDATIVEIENESKKDIDMESTRKTPEEIKAEENLPGAATDAADNDRTTAEEVKDETKELNDLPYVDE
ncbi:MAG: hypothetical protein K2K05_01810, partial [Muribaculaceae bacterium]|nr:hypothetical protein [Muribaculaceae bacterium]